MIEPQLFTLLALLNVDEVWKEQGDGKLFLRLRSVSGTEELPVIELKSRHVAILAELEEKLRDTMENRFAVSLSREVAIQGGRAMEMHCLKKDEQLTADERAEKKRILEEVEKESQFHRTVIAGMNYLQVHYRVLIPKFRNARVPELTLERSPRTARAVWTKGIKSAALTCIKEIEQSKTGSRLPLDICRSFLSQYVIEDEQSYTPEQLFNNVQQILLLDRLG